MKQTVMIFGGGLNQISLIEAAKDLSVTTVVVDPLASPPGKAIADFYYQVAGNDFETTKKIAIHHGVDGIATGQMENPLKMMARLAKELNFVFHSPSVILNSTNKHLMKQIMLNNSIPCAKGELITQGRILSEIELLSYSYPLVIKPVDSYSSRGVYKIDDYISYLDRIETTLSYSSEGEYLIEEYVDGKEYSVEAVTHRGITKIIQFTEKTTSEFPFFVEIAHMQPANLNEKQKEVIASIVTRTISSLGIDNSISHTECKWSKRGPVIIEVGPRMGGGFISSYLTQLSTGLSLDKVCIQLALGIDPSIKTSVCGYSMIKFLALPPHKTVLLIKDYNHLKRNPSVFDCRIYVKEGDTIEELTENGKRSGHVISFSSKRQFAIEAAENTLHALSEHVLLQ